ncbi:MAG: phosphoribosylformylglycinamidine synthase subunit PurQ [Devosia sp.]|uniref:phosphoribosylformylglycinamidine synthase subunit PurQ n=1 Tax=Devosia sp. TaxID=1871048 RepID=UPI003398C863
MKAAVLVFPGLNRDRDMIAALTKIGGVAPAVVWHQDADIPDVDLIVIPGGFSYGDYLRCGAIAARSPMMDKVRERAAKGTKVLGVCNGFQILIEAGLLPGAPDAQHLAQIRLPRSEARGHQYRQRVHRWLCQGPDHPLPRCPS